MTRPASIIAAIEVADPRRTYLAGYLHGYRHGRTLPTLDLDADIDQATDLLDTLAEMTRPDALHPDRDLLEGWTGRQPDTAHTP